MAVQAVGSGAVAMDIDQDIAAMTCGTVGKACDERVIFVLMACAEVGVIAGMAGNAGAAMAAVDGLVGSLQRAGTGGVDMAGATTITALVVDGQDIHGVVALICLVVTRDALGAGGDLAQGHMVDIAMAGLVVVMAGDTGGGGGAIFAGKDGVVDRGLQGQSFGVGLGGGVIAVAKGAGVAGNPLMQAIDVRLRGKGTASWLAKVGRVAGVAVGAGGAGAKTDGAEIVHRGGVMQGRAVAHRTVAAALVAKGAAGQAKVRGVMAVIAIVLVGDGDQVCGAGRVVASGAGRGSGHVPHDFMVGLDVAGMVAGPITDVAFTAIDADSLLAPVDLILIGGVIGVVTGGTGDGAILGSSADMPGDVGCGVAIGTRQGGAVVEDDMVMLGGMWVCRINQGVTEFTITRTIDGAPLEHAGGCGVTVSAGVLVDIGNETGPGVASGGATGGLGQGGVTGGKVVGVVGPTGLVTINALACASCGVTIGGRDQDTGTGGVAGVTQIRFVDAGGPIRFIVTGDTGGSGQDVGDVVVNRTLMVKEGRVVCGVAPRTGVGSSGGIAIGPGNQDAGGQGMTGGTGIGLMDSDGFVALIMAADALGGCLEDRGVVFGFDGDDVVVKGDVEVKVKGVGGVTAGTVTLAIDGATTTIDAGHEDPLAAQVMAEAAVTLVQLGVGDQITRAGVAGLAGVVAGGAHLPDMVVDVRVGPEGLGGMAGSAGVGVAEARVLVGVTRGVTLQRDGRIGGVMAGLAVVMDFWVIGIGDKG